MRKKYAPVCDDCHSGGDVYRTVVSYWSVDRQCWVDERFSDEWLCAACGGNTVNMIEVQAPRNEMDDLLDDVFAVVARRMFKEVA